MTDGRRSIRYEIIPYGNPGTASFPETEHRQGQHAFPRRPEDTVIFRIKFIYARTRYAAHGYRLARPDTQSQEAVIRRW